MRNSYILLLMTQIYDALDNERTTGCVASSFWAPILTVAHC